ncbi:hypothetical protein [Asaia krungthepensis]|uniref:Uncharacterized protein n=1 Tax=Asaia krungthepensis NRIC 0535 TaxID=1307925 RepID=A0ABQ0PY75_9PROT|nr:hypothetical protein [Asaia krungthepensis]GBQ84554.1 hypothetical protein AA0535_0526 [Asaia krungthepensis NRIC 0535]
MRKSISYKKGDSFARVWTLRLILGAGASYALAMGVLSLFRHFGSEAMLVVGFLCAFALMPGIVLVLFCFPSQRAHGRTTGRSLKTLAIVPLAAILSIAGVQ